MTEKPLSVTKQRDTRRDTKRDTLVRARPLRGFVTVSRVTENAVTQGVQRDSDTAPLRSGGVTITPAKHSKFDPSRFGSLAPWLAGMPAPAKPMTAEQRELLRIAAQRVVDDHQAGRGVAPHRLEWALPIVAQIKSLGRALSTGEPGLDEGLPAPLRGSALGVF